MAFLSTVRRARTGQKVWVVHWREAGRLRKRRVGTDRLMAEHALTEAARVERAARGSLDGAESGPELVARFLSAMVAAGKRPGTLDYYGRRLRRWVLEHPGIPPSRWTRAMLDAHLARHPGWSPRTMAMAVAALRRLSRWARKSGVYVPEVTDGVEVPRQRQAARRALQPVEVDRLLAVLDGHRYAAAVALAAYAGLSLGDLRTLTWAEVDLEAGWIVRPEGRRKTGVALRVPILPQLATVLRAHRPLRPHGLVCAGLPGARPKSDGTMPTGNARSLYATLRRAYARAGLPDARGWHLLRHSFGTLLMRAGVPTAVIGRLLSHRPGSVVTALYQHPDDTDLVDAMKALGASLDRAARTH